MFGDTRIFSPDTPLDEIEVRLSHNHGCGRGAIRLTSGHYSTGPRAYSSLAITGHTKQPLDCIHSCYSVFDV